MSKTILKSLAATALALAFTTGAFAQDWRLAAEIPFNFIVGDVKMPSGHYTVQIHAGNSLLIRSTENYKAVVSFANVMTTPQNLKSGRLVFNAYGDRYYLSTVSWPQGPSRIVPPTKAELQIAKEHAVQPRLEVATQ
jgi:hypothetical protein